MNLALLAGTIARPLELRTSAKGKPWGWLLLDTGDGERHRVTLFGGDAEAAARLPVGAALFVRGRVQYSSWEAADGSKRYSTAINASEATPIAEDILADVDRLTRRRRPPTSATSSSAETPPPHREAPPPFDDSDMPF